MSRTLVDAARQALGSDPGASLAAIRRARAELDRAEEGQVGAALAAGWSWARIGRALGVSRQAVHRKYSACPPAISQLREPFFTRPVRLALLIARTEASARGDAVVGTEHALMGLMQQAEGAAVEHLRSQGAGLRRLRAAADVLSPSDLCHVPPGQISFSRRMLRALELAVQDAAVDSGGRVRDDHLLRALLSEADSGAATLLRATGVAPETLVAEPVAA